ncbi:COR domain-containing protein [Lacinutrix gracilariae]|uniref:non-specific serine/threonine protein kinase n=1 Tax=Lacinutrix gracilariae TaxID=1747198 RepID=A0ABW5K323_9FLAO
MSEKTIEIAKGRIQEAKTNKLRFLDLSGLGLNEIPIDISDMTYLLDINLSYNQFLVYPNVLSKLYNLQHLNISHNSLTDIVLDEGKYYSFKSINISYNLLNHIPSEFNYLNKNVEIIFDNNPFLKGLPPEFQGQEDLSYISFYLQSLTQRDNIKKLFETKLLLVGKGEVGKTTLIKVLKNINYDVEIGKENTTHGIDVNSFEMDVIFPANKSFYNRHEDYDNLIFLSDPKYHMFHEEEDVNFNSEEVLYETISEEYAHFHSNHEDFLELRLSSQPHYIRSDAFFKKPVKINTWDFGGQEILYSTHQFFLTQRSVYILVWEPRSDTEEENFDYWLNTIQRTSNGSSVIIVMNKADVRIKNIDENSYLKKFDNIYGFIKVSCFTKDGITELVSQIKDCISKLPHIGDKLPISWDNVRVKLKEVNKDYIDYREFKSICSLNDLKKDNYIVSYLNDLGDIIYFDDDYRVSNLVILNPDWLTNAIYELIHSLSIQKNNGLFNSKDLKECLDASIYPEDKYYEILSLMERFEICFKVIGSNNLYVIPALLEASIDNEEIKKSFLVPEALKFQICYSYMPSGLIERLICRMNNYLEKELFWKFGAVFNTEQSRALVVLNTLSKTIDVSVIGEIKGSLYNIISHEIHQIHRDLKLLPIDFQEKIACNCNECSEGVKPYMFIKDVLNKFLNKNRKEIDCQFSTEKVTIEKLLLGYKSSKTERPLIRDFVEAFSRLQGRAKMIESFSEDERNIYFQDLLRPSLISRGFFSNDQTQRGKSESERNQGELDILIETIGGNAITFFEGFNLNSLKKSVIDIHLKKTLLNYDYNGLTEKFVGIYCEASNFVSLAEKYYKYCNEIEINDIKLISTTDLSSTYVKASEIKVYRTSYERSKTKLNLYHILVNLKL